MNNYLNELFLVPQDLDDAQLGTRYVVGHDMSDIMILWLYFLNPSCFDFKKSLGISVLVVDLSYGFFQHLSQLLSKLFHL
jgi:hypothetical protein